VAGASTLPDLPAGVVRVLTQIVTGFEKNAWFLRATAEAA
jgi:hypothetical protein